MITAINIGKREGNLESFVISLCRINTAITSEYTLGRSSASYLSCYAVAYTIAYFPLNDSRLFTSLPPTRAVSALRVLQLLLVSCVEGPLRDWHTVGLSEWVLTG